MPYVPSLDRSPAYARQGMVATSQSLAVQAGLHVLREGGNAVDAAIATAVALTVVEPVSNGIGGDAFALARIDGETVGLNGSGRVPLLAQAPALDTVAAAFLGWHAVTVPGTPRAWADFHRRAGRLPFPRLFEPAIHYAQHGFVVTPMVARNWAMAANRFERARAPEVATWFAAFTHGGRVPRVGETFAQPDQAESLRAIAASYADAFYEGDLARAIASFASVSGGHLSEADLATHQSDWVCPLEQRYRDATLYELPPNGQGIVALQALAVLEQLDVCDATQAERTHGRIEALKHAFADAGSRVADPATHPFDVAAMLEPDRVADARATIGPLASNPVPRRPQRGGTVYVATADGEGGLVSWIQSNFEFFGSGVVVPGTGIALQNRAAGFELTDATHPNAWAPGKRPYHTIMPGFFEHPERGTGPLGVIGGHMQPQGHVQLVSRLVDERLGLQEAVDAWRFQWRAGLRVDLEMHAEREVADALALRGHEVAYLPDTGRYDFGRAQIILRRPDGVLEGASDSRADGYAAGY